VSDCLTYRMTDWLTNLLRTNQDNHFMEHSPQPDVQPVKIFPALSAFTIARRQSVSLARLIRSSPPLLAILMLSSAISKPCMWFSSSPYVPHSPPMRLSWFYHTYNTWWGIQIILVKLWHAILHSMCPVRSYRPTAAFMLHRAFSCIPYLNQQYALINTQYALINTQRNRS